MADTNPLASVFGVIWGAWLALMTALDPTTVNNPIACTLASLVFGVIFYIILTIAISKITEGHNLEESLIKWVNFLVTVGFTLLMIQQGYVYLIASMMSLMVFMIVLIFGLLFFYYIYAHGKKFAKGAYETSKSARFLKDALRERREEKLRRKEAILEENKTLQEMGEQLRLVDRECKYYQGLVEYLKNVFRTLKWKNLSSASRKVISNYLAQVKSALVKYQSLELHELVDINKREDILISLLRKEEKAARKQIADIEKILSTMDGRKKQTKEYKKKLATLKEELNKEIKKSEKFISSRITTLKNEITSLMNEKRKLSEKLIKLLDYKFVVVNKTILKTAEELYEKCVELYKKIEEELADERRRAYTSHELEKIIDEINILLNEIQNAMPKKPPVGGENEVNLIFNGTKAECPLCKKVITNNYDKRKPKTHKCSKTGKTYTIDWEKHILKVKGGK
ncbi:MAG: hypothetical protein J7K73_03635 [Nanoarchaeota archaeon]|nr:hypothetical protein [Nanoarchaeota archaeon]